MQIPTQLVRVRASGGLVVINASDFDPDQHDLPEAAQPELLTDPAAQVEAVAPNMTGTSAEAPARARKGGRR